MASLAKWLGVRLRTKWLWVRIPLQSLNDTDAALKNCAPFSTCKTDINHVFIDEANQIYTEMPMYYFIEYSDNYSDTSGAYGSLKEMKL